MTLMVALHIFLGLSLAAFAQAIYQGTGWVPCGEHFFPPKIQPPAWKSECPLEVLQSDGGGLKPKIVFLMFFGDDDILSYSFVVLKA